MELKQTLKISQQLIMTPQLQQAIKLLQITRTELIELINEELMTNPFLEEEPQTDITTGETKPDKQNHEKEGDRKLDEFIKTEHKADSYSVYEQFQSDQEEKRFESKKQETLYDKLKWQLNVENFSEEEKEIGRVIIGNIEEDGYLRVSIEEIAKEFNFPLEDVQKVLLKIQEFEPSGIAARNLKECLLIQLRHKNINDPLIKEILEHCLEDIESRNFDNISKKLGTSEERVIEAFKIIRTLNPKPGLTISESEAIPIIPDVIVKKRGNEYEVNINNEGIPNFRMNRYYVDLLNSKEIPAQTRNYLNEKMRAVETLRQGIQKRNNSILLVAKSIIKHQKEFFDRGVEFLKPLVLREIAADVGLHESTVSRICKGKYMETHLGIFEMKKFFSSKVMMSENTEISAELIKTKIKEMIKNENGRVPLTDNEIMIKLRNSGINISRRTVVKYREQMNIPCARKRRRLIKD
jgi:RNA polymerase sigma-54 factor